MTLATAKHQPIYKTCVLKLPVFILTTHTKKTTTKQQFIKLINRELQVSYMPTRK